MIKFILETYGAPESSYEYTDSGNAINNIEVIPKF